MNPDAPTAPGCPQCGSPVPAGAPGGHCPTCLLRTSFGESLGGNPDPDPLPANLAFPATRRLGDYELLDEVARGGMGVVYRARQRSLNRIVAVKVLLAGEFAGPEFVRRFRREAEAAARLRHPNLVAVHEFGEQDGQHFLAMEFVEGRSLSDWVRDGPMPSRRAAGYVRTLARAVAFAHAHGILHRDLKPSNVLIDSATDEPRITDFGLAKRVPDASRADAPGEWEAIDGRSEDSGRLTLTGHALGSPAYMAPEQASGSATAGPAADLYALGALLYHLITGRPPFQGDRVVETLRQVLEEEPLAPRRLNPSIPRDLQTVCLHCLRKDPRQRYASATDLAEDLDRFLSDSPIRAKPEGTPARAVRFARRRPAMVGLGSVVVALVATLLAGTSVATLRIAAARRAEQAERRRFEAAAVELRRTVGVLELRQAEERFDARDPAAAVAHLTALLRREPTHRVAAHRLVSALLHRPWILRTAPPTPHPAGVLDVGFRPDGLQIFAVTRTNAVLLADAEGGRASFTLNHEGPVSSARYDADGTRIVTASLDGTARVWASADGRPLFPPFRHAGPVFWAEFSPDGSLLVLASEDRTASLWSAADGRRLRVLEGHGGPVFRARFTPDGRHLVTLTDTGDLQVWEPRTGERLGAVPGEGRPAHTLALSPDGSRVATGFDGGLARVRELARPEDPGLILRHAPWAPVWHAAFSPDGRVVLTTAEDGTARLWNATNGFPLGTPLVHEGGVVFGTFSPDGETVVTASADVSARLWNWREGFPIGQPLRHREPVRAAAFTRDGRRLATASDDATTQTWEIAPHPAPPIDPMPGQPVTSLDFDRRQPRVLAAHPDGSLQMWDTRTGRALGDPWRLPGAAATCAALNRSDGRITVGNPDGSVRILDPAALRIVEGPVRHAGPVLSIQFGNDGATVVTASADGTAGIWDTLTGRLRTPFLAHAAPVRRARPDPAGRAVVTASDDGTARVWDLHTGQPITGSLHHRDQVREAEFSPDGTRVVTASTDNTACLWDAATGRLCVPPLHHARIVEDARFTPDGRRVVTVSQDRTARVWDADTGQALTPPLPHLSAVSHLALSPEGDRILTAGWNGLARVWDPDTGLPLSDWLVTGGLPLALGFDATGERFGAGSAPGGLRLWEFPAIPLPVPKPFLDFAESLAGVRLTGRGNLEQVTRPVGPAHSPGDDSPDRDDFYSRIERWILQTPGGPDGSPFRPTRGAP